MTHKVEIDGGEVELYTADEVQAREAAARSATEGEYKPKLTAAEAEQQRLNGLLDERAREFAGAREGFQKLSEEQQKKLTATELTLYKNQEELVSEREKNVANNKKAHDSSVDAAIRSKVGTNAELFTKVKDMYGMIQLEDLTPEAIAIRVSAAFGALGQTQPDLLAAAGFGGGGFEPPARHEQQQSFVDTERGKDVAKNLGLAVTEEDVKKELGIK